MTDPVYVKVQDLPEAEELSGDNSIPVGTGESALERTTLDALRAYIVADIPTPTDGEDGRTILNGSGAPVAELGEDGDFYLDTPAMTFYGPKVDGAWGAGRLISAEGLQDFVDAADAAADRAESASDQISNLLIVGKNKANPALIKPGKYYSPGNGKVIADANYRSLGFIELENGQKYTVSGIQPAMTCYVGPDNIEDGAMTSVGFANPSGVVTFTAAAPNLFLWINLTNTGANVTTYDSTVQVEKGASATTYEAYRKLVGLAAVERSADLSAAADVGKDSGIIPRMVIETGLNKINPAKVNFAKRYSTGTKTIINADVNLIAMSDWIPVEEGEFYIVDGAGFYNPNAPQGGFFSAYGNNAAVNNITWAAPPTGTGKMFQVPVGQGITHVVISLATNSGHTALAGNVQMQEGEVATAYEPYAEKLVVPLANIPAGGGGGGGGGSVAFDDAAWFRYVNGESQPYNRDKWPVFSKLMLEKAQDATIAITGTSLTARTVEHHSEHPEAKNRPPLMHSRNLASHMWDKLCWPGQRYARYDDSAVVTEVAGVWATNNNLPEWDDGAYRDGLTRYSATDSAAVSFAIPEGARAWRFIHRTDTVASQQIAVAITGGNGLVEVFNEGTGTWVEANGYTFSQRESAPVARSVSVPNPDTDVFAAISIPSKGNTTYQKRLKFRAVSRTGGKTITFANQDAGTRFNYWGCEWSHRDAMVTLINAARGSHNTQATGATGLPRFADNELHSFKPDLIYGELPIHNDGAAGVSVYSTWDRWGRLTNNYIWRADYELSLMTRANFFGYTPEIGFWTPSIAYNFGGIGEDGELLSAISQGRSMTALDKFDQAVSWARENHPEAVVVHAVRRWIEAGFAIYGDLKTATIASGKSGPSMTNDGSHPNDVGDSILAKLVVGPLDFAAGAAKGGLDGADGVSAYRVAVDNGFVGNEAEWLASLHGADGADAVAPNYTYTLTALEPGEPATISASGVYPDIHLEIGLPRGPAGSLETALPDPGADRIYMWDDTANAPAFLEVADGLEIADGQLKATGAAPEAPWVEIASVSPTGVNTVDFTAIPAGYTDLMLSIESVGHNHTGTSSLQFSYSSDGVTYGSNVALSSIVAGAKASGTREFYGRGGNRIKSYTEGVVADGTNLTLLNVGHQIILCNGGINAFRLLMTIGNFNAGTIRLLGR